MPAWSLLLVHAMKFEGLQAPSTPPGMAPRGRKGVQGGGRPRGRGPGRGGQAVGAPSKRQVNWLHPGSNQGPYDIEISSVVRSPN